MIDPGLFWTLAALTVASALLVVSARNLVHGALAMVVTFALTAVLYLALDAAFLAAVQVIVYAGAIMVLFMFVVMLLGRRDIALTEPIGGQRWLTVPAVLGLAALLLWAASSGVPAAPDGGFAPIPPPAAPAPGAGPAEAADAATVTAAALPGGFGSPAAIGQRLFTVWVLPVEIVSFLLLAAILGVIVIARGGGPAARRVVPDGAPGEAADR